MVAPEFLDDESFHTETIIRRYSLRLRLFIVISRGMDNSFLSLKRIGLSRTYIATQACNENS